MNISIFSKALQLNDRQPPLYIMLIGAEEPLPGHEALVSYEEYFVYAGVVGDAGCQERHAQQEYDLQVSFEEIAPYLEALPTQVATAAKDWLSQTEKRDLDVIRVAIRAAYSLQES